ncbi:hypothetical protein BGZ97_003131 [Linnemannia gamsii]|uniref:Uncharacterized protein n=1 Tax=Linnemannia gamsii TaxID=64522 RepID=A0A9P6QXM2_9FUNG|nr:hypothetical protein BGZ97_003131 [Linnemannia gamsii]
MKSGLSICNDFFRCSLPKSQQDTKHMTTYHDPRPIEIANWVPGGKPLLIHRDPRRNMKFPCTHSECDHLSILRSGPYQHMRHCKFIKRDLQRAEAKASSLASSSSSLAPSSFAASAPVATAALARSVRAQRRYLNQNIVSRGRVGRPSSMSTRAASSTQAASSVRSASTSSESSGSIFDHTPPPRPATPTPTPSPSPPPASTYTSNTTLTQLLTNMQHLADTVNSISKRLNTQTHSLDAMNKQMDWLAEQVDEIRTQNASLDAHTE